MMIYVIIILFGKTEDVEAMKIDAGETTQDSVIKHLIVSTVNTNLGRTVVTNQMLEVLQIKFICVTRMTSRSVMISTPIY